MQVMFLGVCVFAIPGIGVTTIDKVIKSVKFDIILLVATILTLCSALMNQGFGEFMAELVPTLNMPVIGFFAAIVVGIYIFNFDCSDCTFIDDSRDTDRNRTGGSCRNQSRSSRSDLQYQYRLWLFTSDGFRILNDLCKKILYHQGLYQSFSSCNAGSAASGSDGCLRNHAFVRDDTLAARHPLS